MPGRIGILCSTHGLCGTTGMSIGEKKSSQKCPRLVSSQAKPSWCNTIKWCNNFCSSVNKNPGLYLSIISFLSAVYRPQGVNSGGCGESTGRCSKGSPMILQIILNLPGSSPTIGFTFTATGLYFLPPFFFLGVDARCEVRSSTASST